MTEIELGRLREGDMCLVGSRFWKIHGGMIDRSVAMRSEPAFRSRPRWQLFDPSTPVLIDDATLQRVREREAKNAASAAE